MVGDVSFIGKGSVAGIGGALMLMGAASFVPSVSIEKPLKKTLAYLGGFSRARAGSPFTGEDITIPALYLTDLASRCYQRRGLHGALVDLAQVTTGIPFSVPAVFTKN